MSPERSEQKGISAEPAQALRVETMHAGESATERSAERHEKPVAVFVVHGMGQQLPFGTLDQTAQGLKTALLKQKERVLKGSVRMKAVPLSREGERLHRVEINYNTETERSGRPIHVYEAYWAPLTEGVVTLRDVMWFLWRGAWNGLRKGIGQPIERFMFGETTLHRVPWTVFAGLLVTFLLLCSLVLLNTVIAGVVLNGAFELIEGMSNPPVEGYGPSPLVRSLTVLVTGYLIVTLICGLLLGLTSLAMRFTRRDPNSSHGAEILAKGAKILAEPLGYLSCVCLSIWVGATLLSGGVTLSLVAHEFVYDSYDFNKLRHTFIASSCSILILGGISWLHGRTVLNLYLKYGATDNNRPIGGFKSYVLNTLIIISIVAFLGSSVVGIAELVSHKLSESANIHTKYVGSRPFRVAVWATLFLVSAYIRSRIVQYLGDVAAYVSPHILDRFASLRRDIRDKAVTVLRSIYQLRNEKGDLEYDDVMLMGHSLGSVIAYDALNRILVEDAGIAAATTLRVHDSTNDEDVDLSTESTKPLNARERTKLLLTFGSPLDKTAYIFRAQNRSLSDVREALAATVQPMILDKETKHIKWINVNSSRDIIGGRLNLYDRPSVDNDRVFLPCLKTPLLRTDTEHAPPSHSRVINIEDCGARTPLIAHTEYWDSGAIFDTVVQEVLGDRPADRSTPHQDATRGI